MARVFAYNVIFFLLPFAGYAFWLAATRTAVTSAANWPVRNIGYLALGGAILMFGSIFVFGTFHGGAPGKTYVPAKIDTNGVLVPGHFE